MMNTQELLRNVRSLVLVTLSALIYSIAIKMFVESANLIPAGFIGISLVITEIIDVLIHVRVPYMLLYFILQIALTLVVFKIIGTRFAVLSILQFTLMTIFSFFIPAVTLSDDIILISIFGGVLTGISILLALLGEASSGGTDFVAVYFQNKSNIPIWDYIMFFNWGVLLIAGFFFGIEAALYSMVFQFVSTTLVNTFNSRNRLVTLTIITSEGDKISQLLITNTKHGVTVSEAKGAFTNSSKQMLYTVLNEFEVNFVIHEIRNIDPKVFINVVKSEKVYGNFNKKRIS